MLPTKVRMASLGLGEKGHRSYMAVSRILRSDVFALGGGCCCCCVWASSGNPSLAISEREGLGYESVICEDVVVTKGKREPKTCPKGGERRAAQLRRDVCVSREECRGRSVESVRWGFGDGDGRDKTGWAGRVGGKMLSVVLPPRQVRAGFRVVCGGWRCVFVPPFSFQESRVWSVPEPRSKERPGLSGHSKPIREEELLCCPPRDDLFYFLAKIWRIPSFDDLVPTECGCVNVGIASPQTSSVHDRAETARARFRCGEDETGCPLGILTVPRSRMRKEGVSEARLAMS